MIGIRHWPGFSATSGAAPDQTTSGNTAHVARQGISIARWTPLKQSTLFRPLAPGAWAEVGGHWVAAERVIEGYATQLAALNLQRVWNQLHRSSRRQSPSSSAGSCRCILQPLAKLVVKT
jgi:hypothetical protein